MDYLLDDKVAYIIKTLNNHGFEANIVGGCVRDILLNSVPSDFDINTDATPNQIIDIFKGFKIIETGIKHGTLSLILNGKAYEITTYRIDGKYTDYRRPETVKFSFNLADDLARRDFTINALAYNYKDGLLDFHNGCEDLKNQIIRCVGDPYIRFKEDALRILRAIRFASTLGFKIEEVTKKAMFENRHLLLNIANERIYIELMKTLTGKYVSEVLAQFKVILEVFIPELRYVSRYKFIESLKYLAKEKEDQSIILAILLKPLENFNEILKRFKVDNKTYQEVSFLIEHYYYPIEVDRITIRFTLNKMGKDMLVKLLKMQYFVEHIDKFYYDLSLSTIKYIEENKLPYQLKHLEIDGNDIQKFGFHGKEIAVQLKNLLSLVIKNKLNNTREDLYNYLKSQQNKK